MFRPGLRAPALTSLFLTGIISFCGLPPSTVRAEDDAPKTVDRATYEAAMQRLRAKQIGVETPDAAIDRLVAENEKLRKENADLKADVARLEKLVSTAGEGLLTIAKAVNPSPVPQQPTLQQGERAGWAKLVTVAANANWQCFMQAAHMQDGTNSVSQMQVTVAELTNLRRQLVAPPGDLGRKAADQISKAIDSAAAGIKELTDASQQINALAHADPNGEDPRAAALLAKGLEGRTMFLNGMQQLHDYSEQACKQIGTTLEAEMIHSVTSAAKK